MAHEGIRRMAEPRCDNCCFSTFAASAGRPALIRIIRNLGVMQTVRYDYATIPIPINDIGMRLPHGTDNTSIVQKLLRKAQLLFRTRIICRQKKGSEGRWNICQPLDKCPNFHPSRLSNTQNHAPRLIPLTRGLFAIVDAEDYPHLSQYTWFAEGTSKNCYAVRKENGKSIRMHREILNAPDHLVFDHIEHNGLNNRNSNIRLATFTQNCRNQRRSSHKTSKYKGVHWHKRLKKWAAATRCNKKTYHLGYFHDEMDAAKAYDTAARRFHGEFAAPNFPVPENP